MKTLALLIAASLCGALASRPPITQKDVLLMQHLQQMRSLQHSHLSDKDARTLDAIVRNWQSYQAGDQNDFDMRLAAAFVNDTPLDAADKHKRHTIFTHSEKPGKERVASSEGGGVQETRERNYVRDNPYMDGERFPLRRRGGDARAESTESTEGRRGSRGEGSDGRDGRVLAGSEEDDAQEGDGCL